MPATAVVWGTWGTLAVAGLVFVGQYGRNSPFMDEWNMLPALAGDVDAVRWAWEPHGEHRYPVPRLIFLGLFRLTGDLRTAMAVNLLGLSLAAAVLQVAARRARGFQSLADLFFPVSLLHAGHWENLLMSYQVNFVGTVLLGAVLAAAATVSPRLWGWRTVLAVGTAAALLPGFGVFGLVLGLAGAVWLAAVAWLSVRRRAAGKVAALFGFALVAGAGALVCLATRPAGSYDAMPRRGPELLTLAAKLAAVAFGPGVEPAWFVAAPAVGIVAVAAALALFRRSRVEREAVLGPAFLLVACAGLAAGLTWGRGWAGSEVAFTSRYAAVMALVVAVVVLVAVRFGSPELRRWGPAALCVLAVLAWPLNLANGLSHAAQMAAHQDALARDVRDGLPAELIGERYDWQLFLNHPAIARDFETAARIGFTPFRERGPTLAVQTIPLSVRPGQFMFDLPRDPAILAIRVRGEFVPAQNRMADYRIRTREADSAEWDEERFQVVKNAPAPVVGRVRSSSVAFEVIPDRQPVNYRLRAVELIVTGSR